MESRLRPAPSSADNTIKNERRKVSDVGHPSIGIITQRLAIPSLLLNLAFFLFNAISTNVALSSYNDPSSKAYTMDQSVITQHQQSTTVGYVPYEKVVGHLHSPKTAGTEINGELAARYERVCGHKGYSYDAAQFNERVKKIVNSTGNTDAKSVGGTDVISSKYESFNRGRVPLEVMDEIGFEDCDYISLEASWKKWPRIASMWPLELHVPCREPLEHLLSQCNHFKHRFYCSATDLEAQVKKCLMMRPIAIRFDLALTRVPNLTMKCFNPIPIEPYLEHIGHLLERKRIETNYIPRSTNTPRNKTAECVRNNETIAQRVLEILQTYDYYSWCQTCLGSENEILLSAK